MLSPDVGQHTEVKRTGARLLDNEVKTIWIGPCRVSTIYYLLLVLRVFIVR